MRRPKRGDILSRLDAELIHGDLTRPASLIPAVQGVDTILHLGARAAFESYARLHPTIGQGSLGLMQVAQKAGVQRFVYASSLFVYGDVSTGAHNDLQRATDIARAMMLEYGMGETLGPVTFPKQRQPMFLQQAGGYGSDSGREYSEATARALDQETKRILEGRMAHVERLLSDKRHLLDHIAMT